MHVFLKKYHLQRMADGDRELATPFGELRHLLSRLACIWLTNLNPLMPEEIVSTSMLQCSVALCVKGMAKAFSGYPTRLLFCRLLRSFL